MPPALDAALRIVVVTLFFASVIVALTHWAARQGRIGAFGAWPRFVRRVSDPVLQPLERRLVRSGRNPQDAPLWLAGLVLVGGLVLLWLARSLAGAVANLHVVASGGPQALLFAAIRLGAGVLKIALIVRVIGSWFGRGEYSRWLRPAYWLTDWLVRPLRRLVPPIGMFDLTPLVAYIVVLLVEALLLALLAR
jgi:YggT family protein